MTSNQSNKMTSIRFPASVLACIAFLGLPAVAYSQEGISRIAGLSAWYRADNVARAADGTLTALNDAAEGGRTLLAGAKPPVVVEDAVHGRPVLRFHLTNGELYSYSFETSP